MYMYELFPHTCHSPSREEQQCTSALIFSTFNQYIIIFIFFPGLLFLFLPPYAAWPVSSRRRALSAACSAMASSFCRISSACVSFKCCR